MQYKNSWEDRVLQSFTLSNIFCTAYTYNKISVIDLRRLGNKFLTVGARPEVVGPIASVIGREGNSAARDRRFH